MQSKLPQELGRVKAAALIDSQYLHWPICECCGVQINQGHNQDLVYAFVYEICEFSASPLRVWADHDRQTCIPDERHDLTLMSWSNYIPLFKTMLEALWTSGQFYLPLRFLSSQTCHPLKESQQARNCMRKSKTVRYSKDDVMTLCN